MERRRLLRNDRVGSEVFAWLRIRCFALLRTSSVERVKRKRVRQLEDAACDNTGKDGGLIGTKVFVQPRYIDSGLRGACSPRWNVDAVVKTSWRAATGSKRLY
jgi:hypothetical protein